MDTLEKNIKDIISTFKLHYEDLDTNKSIEKKSLLDYLKHIVINTKKDSLKLIFINSDKNNTHQAIMNFQNTINICESTIKNTITKLKSVVTLLAIENTDIVIKKIDNVDIISEKQNILNVHNSENVINIQNTYNSSNSPNTGNSENTENIERQKTENKLHKKIHVNNVNKVILIISGKGGVGKSTLATNLALCLAKSGQKVGLLDADVYGPSIPRMFGLTKANEPKIKDGLFIPLEKYKVNLMSIGFLIEEDIATIWRGPMISKMLHQLLINTMWAKQNLINKVIDKVTRNKIKPLDWLIIDTPPGTGDVHLSLAEKYHIDGAIVITTPQEVAIADTHKSIDMLKKLNIPIIGMVDNMSYLDLNSVPDIYQINNDDKINTSNKSKNSNIKNTEGSKCIEGIEGVEDPKGLEDLESTKNKFYVFGANNVKKYCDEHKVPLIAQIPMSRYIANISDKGESMFEIHDKKYDNIKKEFENITKILRSTNI